MPGRAAIFAAAAAALLPVFGDAAPQRMNRLAKEKSPYLLQHAANPVDWFPWGEEAFEKARREGKPIFLSIGYSTCHWCHVMERESFMSERAAAALNRHFVSIKVDREERPDIDKIYMTAANGAGWGGGWPLSVWLTPERKPFYGGTYFPPESQWGRPGFVEILERLAVLWKEDRPRLEKDSDRLVGALIENSRVEGREAELDAAWFKNLSEQLESSFDDRNGGFGSRPKFPMPGYQEFLLRRHARGSDPQALKMVHGTLSAMAKGGIYDHVGGGFARYSVDGEWRVPHFEKMLYDNAQLAVNYLEAFQAGADHDFSRVSRETLDYLMRDMRSPLGGFYSAEDADSLPAELAAKGYPDEGHAEKQEGAFYLWTSEEVSAAIGSSAAEIFSYRYGIEKGGNAPEDPHGEFGGKNILYEAHSLKQTAEKFGRSEAEIRRLMKTALAKLLELRARRPRPSLDDKVLASWNGLALSAFAKGSAILEEPRYLEAARQSAAFVRKNLFDSKTGALYHRWRDGEKRVPAFADDYAFLIRGLLDLYEASFEPAHLLWAESLADRLLRDFYDKNGGFYMTAQGSGKDLLIRVMEDSDNVEPSASSVAADSLLRLAQFTGREDLRAAALKTLVRFGAQMKSSPRSLPVMLASVDRALEKPRQIVIAGNADDPTAVEMLRAVRSKLLPPGIVMFLTPETRGVLEGRLPQLKGMVPVRGETTAYVCVNFACELPTRDLAEFSRMIKGETKLPGIGGR